MTIPGAGIPLAFNRTYDAEAAQSEVPSSAPAGPLGYGWTDNLNMSVSYNSSAETATVTQANGSQLHSSTTPRGPPSRWDRAGPPGARQTPPAGSGARWLPAILPP